MTSRSLGWLSVSVAAAAFWALALLAGEPRGALAQLPPDLTIAGQAGGRLSSQAPFAGRFGNRLYLAAGPRIGTVHGVAVCDDAPTFERIVKAIGRDLPALGRELHDDWRVVEGYQGPGYAKAGPEVWDLVRTMARLEGVLVDPVYTGKALHGLVGESLLPVAVRLASRVDVAPDAHGPDGAIARDTHSLQQARPGRRHGLELPSPDALEGDAEIAVGEGVLGIVVDGLTEPEGRLPPGALQGHVHAELHLAPRLRAGGPRQGGRRRQEDGEVDSEWKPVIERHENQSDLANHVAGARDAAAG